MVGRCGFMGCCLPDRHTGLCQPRALSRRIGRNSNKARRNILIRIPCRKLKPPGPKKRVPVGPQHQADVPGFSPQHLDVLPFCAAANDRDQRVAMTTFSEVEAVFRAEKEAALAWEARKLAATRAAGESASASGLDEAPLLLQPLDTNAMLTPQKTAATVFATVVSAGPPQPIAKKSVSAAPAPAVRATLRSALLTRNGSRSKG